MKKLSVLLLFVALLGFSGITSAETVQEKGYILLYGNSTREVQPNVAEITFSIETNNKDPKMALQENNKIATNVVNALKPKLDEKKDVIKTGNISLYPNYTYSKDGKKSLNNYSATNSLLVKTTNTEKVSELIDSAIANGANRMSGLNFSFTDEKKVCSELYPEIISDLKKQANTLVSSLNSSIIGIKYLTASCGSQYTFRYNRVMNSKAAMADGAGESSTPVESGKVNVNANVELQFFVK